MNILITLPKHLIEKIVSGEKKFEMRKCLPKHMKIGDWVLALDSTHKEKVFVQTN